MGYDTLSSSKILGENTQEITLFSHQDKGNNAIEIAHKHDFYLLLFVEKGSGIHTIDFIEYPVENYQIHFLAPQQVHQWRLGEETSGYQLMFTQEALRNLPDMNLLVFSSFTLFPVLQLTKEHYEVFKALLSDLALELAKHRKIDKEVASLLFQLIVKKIHRLYIEEKAFVEVSVTDDYIQRFYQELEQHFRQESKVSFYAEKLKITPNYLNIRAKKVLRQSASEVIQQRVLLEIKRLLIITDLSIKEIAYDLSFSDTSYFNNFFKKKEGITPGEFRLSYKMHNKEA